MSWVMPFITVLKPLTGLFRFQPVAWVAMLWGTSRIAPLRPVSFCSGKTRSCLLWLTTQPGKDTTVGYFCWGE